MLDWKEILKVQVLDTSTSLSTINEPMLDDDNNCCDELKKRLIDWWKEWADLGNQFTYEDDMEELERHTFWVKKLTCDELLDWFESEIRDGKNIMGHRYLVETFMKYEDCLLGE
tara:strand:- start:901 stop:1242 length:342 start_codon:yes stop_codon:yes gene_type:complete